MHRWSNGRRMPALALIVLTLHTPAAGCASRTVPPRFPASAAASPGAPAGQPAVVTDALTEEPPLPGQPTSRWPGLHAAPAPQHAHGGHHGR